MTSIGFNQNEKIESEHGIGRFMSDWSIEIVPVPRFSCSQLSGHVPRGTSVYVTSIPGQGTEALLAASKALSDSGFDPIPHIAARAVRNVEQLRDLLSALNEEAGVEKLLILGGDTDVVAGPFASSRQLLESGVLARYRFKQVGFATYPEGHARIEMQILHSELQAKLRIASELGLGSWLVSQLCFDTPAIIQHVERLRSCGIHVPLRIGFAGPTSWKGMMKFAAICGVAASTRSLRSQASQVGRLMAGFEPSKLIGDIASFSANNPSAGTIKPHFFTFGGAGKTVAWLDAYSRQVTHSGNPVERDAPLT